MSERGGKEGKERGGGTEGRGRGRGRVDEEEEEEEKKENHGYKQKLKKTDGLEYKNNKKKQ